MRIPVFSALCVLLAACARSEPYVFKDDPVPLSVYPATRIEASPDGRFLALWSRASDPSEKRRGADPYKIAVIDTACATEPAGHRDCTAHVAVTRSPIEIVYWSKTGKSLYFVLRNGVFAQMAGGRLTEKMIPHAEVVGGAAGGGDASDEFRGEYAEVAASFRKIRLKTEWLMAANLTRPILAVKASKRDLSTVLVEGDATVPLPFLEPIMKAAEPARCGGDLMLQASGAIYRRQAQWRNLDLPPDTYRLRSLPGRGGLAMGDRNLVFLCGTPQQRRLAETINRAVLSDERTILTDLSFAGGVAFALVADEHGVSLLKIDEGGEVASMAIEARAQTPARVTLDRIGRGELLRRYTMSEGTRTLIVYYHGGPGRDPSQGRYDDRVSQLLTHASLVLVPVVSGYSGAGGEVSVRLSHDHGAFSADANAVADIVVAEHPDQVLIVGESFGAVHALALSQTLEARRVSNGVALIAPWLSPRDPLKGNRGEKAGDFYPHYQRKFEAAYFGDSYADMGTPLREQLASLQAARWDQVVAFFATGDLVSRPEDGEVLSGAKIITQRAKSHSEILDSAATLSLAIEEASRRNVQR